MRLLPGIAILFALSSSAFAKSVPDAAGLYEINQMEMAGGLELRPDGRFRYALEYGAVSEEGAGKWTIDGSRVLLTSDPMPRSPDFELIKDDPAPKGELYVTVAPSQFGNWTDHPKIGLLEEKARDLRIVDLEEDGRVPLNDWWPTSIVLITPIYMDEGSYFRLADERGHRMHFRFVPNDLGKARFDGELLAEDEGNLVLDRYDAKIIFKRVQPRPR